MQRIDFRVAPPSPERWSMRGSPGIPVALVNTSLHPVHAHAALPEILTTMSARVLPEASVRIPLLDRTLDAAGIAADPALAETLRTVLVVLASAGRRERYGAEDGRL